MMPSRSTSTAASWGMCRSSMPTPAGTRRPRRSCKPRRNGAVAGLGDRRRGAFSRTDYGGRCEREIERRIRGADGARAGQRQGDVPFDVRRPGADGRPDPATDHIGRAEPLRKQKYYGAQRVPQSRRVEKREFQGLGAGKAQVCKVLSTIKTAASRTDWSRNFARGSSIKKKLRRRN